MKKLVVETIVKEVNDDVENVLSKNQFIQEIENTIITEEREIGADESYTITGTANGYKGIRIISDIELRLKTTYSNEDYILRCSVKDISLLGNSGTGGIGEMGEIVITNPDLQNTAHIKLIYYY